MLARSQAQVLFERALDEFAPEWTVAGPCEELILHHPEHWPSGIGTFGFTIRPQARNFGRRFSRNAVVPSRGSSPA